MNTIAARYACAGEASCKIGIENYYGKAVIELGLIGAIVLAVFLVLIGIVVLIIRQVQKNKKPKQSSEDDDEAQYEKDALALAEGTQED